VCNRRISGGVDNAFALNSQIEPEYMHANPPALNQPEGKEIAIPSKEAIIKSSSVSNDEPV
jgi:hypothetical protein